MPRGFKHGLKYTPEYRVWVSMRQRCNNSSRWDYRYYGGRGILVCEEWNSVINFVRDMGERPSPRHQLDRRDNNAGYSKANCRWIKKTPQMRNTGISKWWWVFGIRYPSLSAAAVEFSTTPSRIKAWCEGRSDGGYVYPPKQGCWSEMKYD